MEVLEKAVAQRVEGTQVEERADNKMWLVRYLEVQNGSHNIPLSVQGNKCFVSTILLSTAPLVLRYIWMAFGECHILCSWFQNHI